MSTTLDECPADNAPRNVATGEPILASTDGKPYLRLTRTLYMPLSAVREIREPFSGAGTELITNRGLMRVCESYADVLEAYEEAVALGAKRGGAE